MFRLLVVFAVFLLLISLVAPAAAQDDDGSPVADTDGKALSVSLLSFGVAVASNWEAISVLFGILIVGGFAWLWARKNKLAGG